MDIIIREIERDDYPEVLSLWNNELGLQSITAENLASYHDKVKTDKRYKTFVALFEGKTVGVIATVQSYAVMFEVGFIHITGISVKKELQSRGIGTKLLKYVEIYAKTKSINSIVLFSGVQSTDAHAFYQHNGYDKDFWGFEKKL